MCGPKINPKAKIGEIYQTGDKTLGFGDNETFLAKIQKTFLGFLKKLFYRFGGFL